jgi:hypothetical protein
LIKTILIPLVIVFSSHITANAGTSIDENTFELLYKDGNDTYSVRNFTDVPKEHLYRLSKRNNWKEVEMLRYIDKPERKQSINYSNGDIFLSNIHYTFYRVAFHCESKSIENAGVINYETKMDLKNGNSFGSEYDRYYGTIGFRDFRVKNFHKNILDKFCK